jgi:hypothetical protein
MSKVITKGKVDTFNPANGRLVCIFDGTNFVWKGGRVRIGGTRLVNKCDPSRQLFDVTVSAGTAAKLVHDFVFELEYEDSDPGPIKSVTKFAGQVLSTGTATFSALDPSGSSPNLPATNLAAPANSPSSLPPAPSSPPSQ